MKPESLAINVGVAVAVGAILGVAFGAAFGNIAMGVALGPAIGLAVCLAIYGKRVSSGFGDRDLSDTGQVSAQVTVLTPGSLIFSKA